MTPARIRKVVSAQTSAVTTTAAPIQPAEPPSPQQHAVPLPDAQDNAHETTLAQFLSHPLEEIIAFVEHAYEEKAAERAALAQVIRALVSASTDEGWFSLFKLAILHEMVLGFPVALVS